MARRRSKLDDLDRDKSDYALRTWAEHGYPKHKKGFNGQCPLEEDDPQDYESYTYEYKTQKYLKKPGESADIKSKEYARKNKHLPPTRRPYSDIPHENEYKTENRYQHKNQKAGYSERDSYSTDPMLDHAATKIQAAFRGYQARKDFWKKREHHRRQNLLNAKQYRQDEYTIASVTSIVDDASISSLATNADPNLGLSSSLPYVDSSQRLNIAQKLKSTLSCFDDVSLVSQLRSERSPNIISLGGINPPQANDYVLGASMFVYNIQKDKWFFGGTMPEPRNYHTAAYLNGKIYVIGGYSPLEIVHNQMVATQSTYELSVRSKRWRKRADMHQARACHGMCVIDDNIVIFGGRDSAGKLLSTMEMYYPKRDEWRFLKSMPEAVMGLACAVLDGCIFAIGGIINEGHQSRYAVSDRVYAFGFEEQKWYKATSLPEPRAFASAATLNREIFLWGGVKDALNEDGYLLSTNSVLVYNNDLSKWEHHMAVGTMKHAAAIAKCGRRVYILGGMSNASNYKEVLMENDYYNRETDKYMEGASLPRPLAGSAAVAVPIDYIATSDPKWNSEKVNDDVKNEAATKIQATYRGYKVRSVISSNKFPAYSSSAGKMKRNDFCVMHASTAESRPDKWKFHRVQIENWPPPDLQTANTEIDLRIGNLPRGYTVTPTISGNKVKRYACLPPYVDPNLSMMGHLCSANKKAKKYVGLRKVECLRPFKLKYAEKLQHDCMPMILVMGGLQPKDPVNPNYGKLMLRYNILKNQWKYFSALPEPRNYHAAVYYKENIYVCGGCNPDKVKSGEMIATSTMYCLNIESGEWAEKAEMHCCRSHHSLVEYDGKICAIGGRDDNGRLVASIEYYEVEANKWIMGRPMDNPRMGMACAVKDDHIWCMGGIGVSEDLETYPVLSSVISYDINNKQWITRPPLRCPRAYGSCVVAGKNMWLVGGASKDSSHEVLVSMGSIDKYNEVEARWKRKTVMSNPRHSAAVVAIDTCIYVFGGVSSQEWCPLARNEMLVTDDVSLHQCEPLPVPLTGLAAVAVPPLVPSLRSESLAILLHTNLTYHD